jgi:hypothetical protein
MNRDLISIGVCADSGEKFYGENLDYLKPWASKWVNENVVPLLNPVEFGMKRLELSARLWSWIEELPCDQVIISADYHGDFQLLDDLFDSEKHPKISSNQHIFNVMYAHFDKEVQMMGGTDTDYQQRVRSAKTKFDLYFFEYFLRTGEIQHHALSDAIANCEAYSRLVLEMGIPK